MTSARRAGFTLIEVLAVVLLTGLVLGVALDFYLDLSRASQRAADHTRAARRATAVLDRVARDFESAVLVIKPEEVDPLAHPWIFLGESRGSELGSDHVKFITRNREPRSSGAPESDLAMVAYTLRRGEAGGLELWRWEMPRLPESLDREFPLPGSEGEVLLADGVGGFGVTFLDAAWEPHATWDSSTMIDASELPLAVSISLAMADPAGEQPIENLTVYRRRAVLAVRPIDLARLLSPADDEEGEDDEEDDLAAKTVCDCIDCAALSASPSTARLIQEVGTKPASQWLGRIPRHLRQNIKPECR
jgi:prepilin-type N-terminal cleavage/methylation domain-containing protein